MQPIARERRNDWNSRHPRIRMQKRQLQNPRLWLSVDGHHFKRRAGMRKKFGSLGVFFVAWIGIAAVKYFLNDPYHNDEGSVIGVYLDIVLFPLGILILIVVEKFFIHKRALEKKWASCLWTASLAIIINIALFYGSIFLVKTLA